MLFSVCKLEQYLSQCMYVPYFSACRIAYSNMHQMRHALLNGGVSGVLVDSYAAAHFQSFDEFRVNELLEADNRVYGMVLGSRLTNPKMYGEIMNYVENNKMNIVEDIVKNVKNLKVSDYMGNTDGIFKGILLRGIPVGFIHQCFFLTF